MKRLPQIEVELASVMPVAYAHYLLDLVKVLAKAVLCGCGQCATCLKAQFAGNLLGRKPGPLRRNHDDR